MEKAFQDLVWLSERLSGIIAIKDELKDYSDLVNRSKEMDKVVQEGKKTYERSLNRQVEAESEIEKAYVKAKEILEDAKAKAKEVELKTQQDIKAKADAENKKLLEQVEAAESKVAKTEAAVEEASKRLTEVKAQVSSEEERLASIQQEINSIKERIS